MTRTLRTLLLALALGWVQSTVAAVLVGVPDTDVQVERRGDSFTVDIVMHAPVPPLLAWAVLTDFEHMALFLPNLTSSQVLERGDGFIRVGQKGVARFGVFSTEFESIREVRLTPPREIRAHGVGGNIRRIDTVMNLEAEGSGTRLHYHAEIQPGYWFPPLLGPSLVRHETAEQFSAMIREMVRRQSAL